MDFTFPKDKVLLNGTLKQHLILNNGKVSFEFIDIYKPLSNLIQIDNTDYYFTYLNSNGDNKGGNSIILKLFEAQNINIDDPVYDTPDLIIKIHKNRKKSYLNRPQQRFIKEIDALYKCKENNFENIIIIEHSGICKIFDNLNSKFDEYFYYTMEYAQFDLKSFIEVNHNMITIEEKVSLCIDLAKGLKELLALGFYHRDIKPDNIFMNADGKWKIGDLGLINDRNNNFQLDKIADNIGPKGWMTPESMNKYLTEGKGFNYKYHCDIDHQSDIFQLGKVFWYIIQHNAPIGTVKEIDFIIKKGQLYPIIKTMLNHSKSKRFKNIDEVIKLLKIEEH